MFRHLQQNLLPRADARHAIFVRRHVLYNEFDVQPDVYRFHVRKREVKAYDECVRGVQEQLDASSEELAWETECCHFVW